MGVMTTLAQLLAAGVRLDYADPDRPEFRAAPAHRPRVAALLTPDVRPETHKALRMVARYRRAVLRLYATMSADRPTADPDAYQAETALHDELGPRLAGLIRADAAADYARRTQRCAWCGGPEHDAALGDG